MSTAIIAAELREAIASGRQCDASTFHHVERRCIELLVVEGPARTAVFVAAQIARTLAGRLEGEAVEADHGAYWTTLGNSLADALEQLADDPAADGWVQLIRTLYPPKGGRGH